MTLHLNPTKPLKLRPVFNAVRSRGNKRIKGAARQELMARTEDLRGVRHIEKTQRQKPTLPKRGHSDPNSLDVVLLGLAALDGNRSLSYPSPSPPLPLSWSGNTLRLRTHKDPQVLTTHDIERFTAQDLRCKKYANSGLQPQALVPPGTAPTHALLQRSDVADPFELGGLGDSDLEETCPAMAEVQSLVSDKPPCVNELVRIGMKADVYQGEPQATRTVLKLKAAKAVVKKDASLKGHVSGKRVTEAHPDITRQCLDDTCWTRIFLPTLSHALYLSDHPFSDWAWESSALVKTVQCVFDLSFTNISYTLGPQDGIVKAIASDVLSLVKTFFERAEFNGKPEKIREYVHWALCSGGPAYYENPVPKSTSKLRKGDPNYVVGSPSITWIKEPTKGSLRNDINCGRVRDESPLDRILDQVSEPHWARALDFVDCEMENRMDESLLSAYRADFHLSSSPTKSGV
ncbi:hypothetical protein BJY52DRAFT_1225494 [Lactarius psammicola]|nr:hypothetical protein BJY52DRAFT_1225494 [Lactarius psammicola]